MFVPYVLIWVKSHCRPWHYGLKLSLGDKNKKFQFDLFRTLIWRFFLNVDFYKFKPGNGLISIKYDEKYSKVFKI